MNYLAHLSLSGNDGQIMAGNFIGDSMRGIDLHSFPPHIQKGIHLHRFIDDFTDHHQEFIKAKKYFSVEFDKYRYSGALVDIFFDHFLATHFSRYFKGDLQEFAYHCYTILGQHYFIFPEKAKHFFQYMVQNNILFNYSRTEGIEKVLEGMTYRINEKALLFNAFPIFLSHYRELEKHFENFFPELMHACADFLSAEKYHRS
jgi:acyl carrier protein phosphodiesterase